MADISHDTAAAPAQTKQATGHHVEAIEHVKELNEALTQTESYQDETPVTLGWRSWTVVLITLFA